MQLHRPNSSISVKSDKPYFLVSFIVALVTPLSVFYKTLEKRFCAAYSIGHWKEATLFCVWLNVYRALNGNQLTGSIPPGMGQLSKLVWFDLSVNNISGPLPISNATQPGLDQMKSAQHL